jgi:hypothetical protein
MQLSGGVRFVVVHLAVGGADLVLTSACNPFAGCFGNTLPMSLRTTLSVNGILLNACL